MLPETNDRGEPIMHRIMIMHGVATVMLIIGAIFLLGSFNINDLWSGFGGHLTTLALSSLIAVAMMLVGRRPDSKDLVLAATAALIFFNAMLLTYAPLLIESLPRAGRLNWTGKLLSLGYVGFAFVTLPSAIKQASGLLVLPERAQWRFAGLMLGSFALFGIANSFAVKGTGDPLEATLFQLTLPSLSEELLFRTVLLALLAGIGAAQSPGLPSRFGRAAVATSVLFGLIHGFLLSPTTGFVIQPVPIVATGLFGAAFAWLTIRTGSVWPALVAHSLVNATEPVLRLLRLI